MSRRSSVLLATVLGACGGASAPPAQPVANHADPAVGQLMPPVSGPPCDKAAGTEHPLDLDFDPATSEVAVEDMCLSPLRCTYKIYAERDACWALLGTVGELMDQPYCQYPHPTTPLPKGSYCTLVGMRLMIHGDAYEYEYAYANGYGVEQYTGHSVDPPHHP